MAWYKYLWVFNVEMLTFTEYPIVKGIWCAESWTSFYNRRPALSKYK